MALRVGYLQKIRGLMHLHRALVMVWESAKVCTVSNLILMAIQAFLPLITLYLIKLTFDAVEAGIIAADKAAAFKQILIWICLTGILTLVTAGFRSLSDIVRENQSQLVTDYVTDQLHRQSAAVALSYYEDPRYYDTLHRAQQEAPYRPTHVVQALTQLGQNSLSLMALAGLLFYLHWSIAVILFVAVLPGIMIKIRHAHRLYEWQSRSTETERKTNEYHWMLTGDLYAKELRLFGLGDLFRKRYRDLREKLRSERLQLSKSRFAFDIIAQAGAIAALFGMLVFITLRTIKGQISLGDMVMYYGAFQRAQGHMQDIIGGLAGLYEDSIFLNYFHEFMDLQPQAATLHKSMALPHPMRDGIKLEHVSFRYPSTDKDVLKDINLTMKPGEVVALVGDNGAGKTTVAKLLCRLYDPQGGRITIDGIDYSDFDIQSLRREITMILQDYIHYPLTAKENIWIGDVNLLPDDERIRLAAQYAGADTIIRSLPQGYETVLGYRFEGGTEISIGEWQKVALARAFLRNAQLIILDEPTSSLSARMEEEIFQAFRTLLKGRSALLISHRFSTVQMADLIYVMEDGRITERGSHEELLHLGGYYARMYEIQSKHYR